jgi:hypothetical protein
LTAAAGRSVLWMNAMRRPDKPSAMAASEKPLTAASPHPNDVDRKRIERALGARQRYRYVSPRVRAVHDGYRIESPCCSRNLDPEGGLVDIALLQYDRRYHVWHLHCREPATQQWQLYGTFQKLPDLLELLNADPERLFWR